MKKSVMEKWVKSLRSGKYKQGKHQLKFNDKYCCLGVLCSISELSEFIGSSYNEAISFLPNAVQEWSGIKTKNGSLPGMISLQCENDTGKTFLEIADIIEKNYKEL